MKCEYENAVHKLLDLADIIKNRGSKPLWKNGILDKRVKDRLLTIGKILNTTKSDTGEKQCNLPDVNVRFDTKLRDKFFKECTDPSPNSGRNAGIRPINLTAHDLFEWFKRNAR